MSNEGWGKPSYDHGANFKRNWKWCNIKPGDNFYRILPPMKKLAASGQWKLYLKVHWGYAGINPKDETKNTPRPFLCIEEMDFRTKMITQNCPESDLITQQKELYETTVARLKTEGKSEEDIETVMAPLKLWLQTHKSDNKWHMLVMNEMGEFGVLRISHRTQKQLLAEIDTIRKNNQIDPLSLNEGVWWNFHRTGNGFEVPDTIKPVFENVREGNRVLQALKMAPLTEEQATRALELCPDLTEVVRSLTFSEIRSLVESNGDPELVDKVFGISQKYERSGHNNHEEEPEPEPQMATTTSSPVLSMPMVKTTPKTPEVVTPKPIMTVSTAPATSPTPGIKLPSAEEFLRKMQLKK